MKVGILFSGGKDSTYAAWLARQYGCKLTCLISVISKNDASYMFHTPSIEKTKHQAEAMELPIVIKSTKGNKESELVDLEEVISDAKEKYGIEGVVTGAVESVYQSSRIQKICDKLGLECFNPLWQKDQIELLEELVKNKFRVVITGVFAYPLDKSWIGREINMQFIEDVKKLKETYEVNPAGEGGEFETFVLNCPLFKKELEVRKMEVKGEKNSWTSEVEIV